MRKYIIAMVGVAAIAVSAGIVISEDRVALNDTEIREVFGGTVYPNSHTVTSDGCPNPADNCTAVYLGEGEWICVGNNTIGSCPLTQISCCSGGSNSCEDDTRNCAPFGYYGTYGCDYDPQVPGCVLDPSELVEMAPCPGTYTTAWTK